MQQELHACRLCERDFTRPDLTKHHCLPRQKGGVDDDVELLCRQFHSMVHATYTKPPWRRSIRRSPSCAPRLN